MSMKRVVTNAGILIVASVPVLLVGVVAKPVPWRRAFRKTVALRGKSAYLAITNSAEPRALASGFSRISDT